MSTVETNMKLWREVEVTPANFKKKITGGRLAGFDSINPMYRIETLTRLFGPVGQGWKYTIDNQQIVAGANGESMFFLTISLYVRDDASEWSAPIVGVGGATIVESTRNGMRSNDDAIKMALTDALSVACKALGIGADVYWGQSDGNKYEHSHDAQEQNLRAAQKSHSKVSPDERLKQMKAKKYEQI